MSDWAAELEKFCDLYATGQVTDDKFKLALIRKLAAANPTDLFDFACRMMTSKESKT